MIDLTTFGWFMLILGIILILYGATKFFTGTPISLAARGVIAIVGIIFVVFAFSFAGAVAPAQQVSPTPSPTPLAPTVTFTGFSASTTLQGNSIHVLTKVNVTTVGWTNGQPAGGIVTFDAKILSNDLNNTFYSIVLGSNPTATNATSGNSTHMITQYTNGSMEATVQTPSTTFKNDLVAGQTINVFVKAASTAQVNFTFYLDAQAFANLWDGSTGAGSSLVFDFSIAGAQYSVDAILIGVAPA